jgi:hypothetical protein
MPVGIEAKLSSVEWSVVDGDRVVASGDESPKPKPE